MGKRARVTLEFNLVEGRDVEKLRLELLKAFKFSVLDKMFGTEDDPQAGVSRKFEIVEGLGGLP